MLVRRAASVLSAAMTAAAAAAAADDGGAVTPLARQHTPLAPRSVAAHHFLASPAAPPSLPGLSLDAGPLASAALQLSGAALTLIGDAAKSLGVSATAAAQAAAKVLTPTKTAASAAAAAAAAATTASTSARAAVTTVVVATGPPEDLGMQLTLGGLCGFASGYTLKKVGKVALFVVGVGFISLQVARQLQLRPLAAPAPSLVLQSTPPPPPPSFESEFRAIEAQLVRALDADGDGVVSVRDVKVRLDSAVAVLGFGLPSGAAFASAFYLGLRYG